MLNIMVGDTKRCTTSDERHKGSVLGLEIAKMGVWLRILLIIRGSPVSLARRCLRTCRNRQLLPFAMGEVLGKTLVVLSHLGR
jgi:hypothetical protein